MDMNKGTDINVGSIEEDIKRCEKLTKPQNANWIGISNQIAIAHVIERIKELEVLEDDLKDKRIAYVDTPEFEEKFIAKQEVKEGLEKIEGYFDRLNGPDEDIEYIRQVKNELLGEEK